MTLAQCTVAEHNPLRVALVQPFERVVFKVATVREGYHDEH